MDKSKFSLILRLSFRNFILSGLLLLFCITSLKAQLSGTYTIDPNGSGTLNYTSFGQAVNDLNTNGVSGAVVFEVADGDYMEKITIPAITGASASNTISFRSSSVDSSKARLHYPSDTVSTDNFVVFLNGADYIVFSHLTIERTDTHRYGNVVSITGGATNNAFLNNRILGVYENSGSTTSRCLIILIGLTEHNNRIANNLMKRSGRGIYFYSGPINGRNQNTIVENNYFDSVENYAISLTYQRAPIVRSNYIKLHSTFSNGITIRQSEDDIWVYNNRIELPNGGSGIYFYGCGSSATKPALIYNNMITVGGSNNSRTEGIYIGSGYNHIIANNNINITSLYSEGTALNFGSSLSSVLNNIFANTGGGYAISTNGIPNNSKFDYNAYFTTGDEIASSQNAVYRELSDWQNVSQLDSNSISVNPWYMSSTDLHVQNYMLKGAGMPLSFVSHDFDGDVRDTIAPDIGADEFTSLTFDAGIVEFISPVSACAGTRDVLVNIMNNGTTVLDSIHVTYILDGTTVNSGFHQLGGLNLGQTITLNAGTIGLNNTPQEIQIIVKLPNNSADETALNDTLSTNVRALMSGTYTIGGNNADFQTITSALDELKNVGICSPVVFNIADGLYNEQLEIPEIYGASAVNTITFQSSSGDSSKVIITQASSVSSANNYVVWLNGADYITFSKIGMERTGSNQYGRVLEISGEASNNQFINNLFQGVYRTQSSTFTATVYSGTGKDSNNYFGHNMIRRGTYGIYYQGQFNNSATGVIAEHNIIDSAYSQGIYFSNLNSPLIRYNTITNLNYNSAVGIRLSFCEGGIKVHNNYIKLNNGGIGIELLYTTAGSVPEPRLIYNNMILVTGDYSATGMYLSNNQSLQVAFNSIRLSSTANSTGISLSGNTFTRLYNNNITNFGGGFILSATANQVYRSDNNNFFTTGEYLFNVSSSQFGLDSWQSFSKQDSHSISIDPRFFGNDDLHTREIALNASAVPISGITVDFDGEPRDSISPDIGADEFIPADFDVAILEVLEPVNACSGNQDIKVHLKNNGLNNIDSVRITYLLNDQHQKSEFYSLNNLASGSDTILTVGSINLNNDSQFVKFFSDLPNNNTDGHTYNDTLTTTLRAILSGTFTIADSNADYSTINDAVNDLVNSGICGAVVFEIADGEYNEQVSIPEIKGASATNTITFRSSSGDSSKAIISFASTFSSFTGNYVLQLDGADYVIIEKLGLQRTGSASPTYARVLDVSNKAKHNIIRNNRIIGILPTSETNNKTVVYSVTPNNDSNTFSRNYLSKGSEAFYIATASGYGPNSGLVIEHNVIDSMYAHGMNISSQYSPIIRYNQITNIIYSVGNGIKMFLCPDDLQVHNNFIHLPKGGRGIAYSSVEGTATLRGRTYNNLIKIEGNSFGIGIDAEDAYYQDFVFNTVNVETHFGGTAFELGSRSSRHNIIKNNIFANLGTGYAIIIDHVSSNVISSSDHNAFFTNGTSTFRYDGTGYKTLAAWQTGTGLDANSVNINARFTGADNLTPQSAALKNNAQPISGITMDFYNNLRDSLPDIGAIEFTPVDNDLSVTGVVMPTCGDSNALLGVVVYNGGSNGQSNFTIEANITGTSSHNFSETYSGTLLSDATDTFYFSDAINTIDGGTWIVNASVNLSGDAFTDNDSLEQNLDVQKYPDAGFSKSTSGRKVTLTSNEQGAASYTWDFGDGNSDTGPSTTHTYAQNGAYTILHTVTNSGGCKSNSSDTVIIDFVGMDDPDEVFTDIDIYPNPFSDETGIVIRLQKPADVQILIFDLTGRNLGTINKGTLPIGEHRISITAKEFNLPAGVSIIKLSIDGVVAEKQIIRLN